MDTAVAWVVDRQEFGGFLLIDSQTISSERTGNKKYLAKKRQNAKALELQHQLAMLPESYLSSEAERPGRGLRHFRFHQINLLLLRSISPVGQRRHASLVSRPRSRPIGWKVHLAVDQWTNHTHLRKHCHEITKQAPSQSLLQEISVFILSFSRKIRCALSRSALLYRFAYQVFIGKSCSSCCFVPKITAKENEVKVVLVKAVTITSMRRCEWQHVCWKLWQRVE